MSITLLLVSADASVHYVLRRYAETSRFVSMSCGQRTAAVEMAAAVQPGVIVLDSVPGINPDDPDEWDTLRQLKAHADTRMIPVIVCSWQERHVPDDLASAVAGWLKKPVLYQEFVALVSSITGSDRTHISPDKPEGKE